MFAKGTHRRGKYRGRACGTKLSGTKTDGALHGTLQRSLLSGKKAVAHIIVIGAGITGVTTAYALLGRGHAVTVIDRQRYPAMETSFANGGQLSASNAEVWNSWSTILKGLKWMLKADAPLLMNPRPSYHKYSWMAEFCAQIGQYRANTIETTRLAIAARDHLFKMAENENIDFDLQRRGILHLYHDKASASIAAILVHIAP